MKMFGYSPKVKETIHVEDQASEIIKQIRSDKVQLEEDLVAIQNKIDVVGIGHHKYNPFDRKCSVFHQIST